MSNGLFHRAISESGGCTTRRRHRGGWGGPRGRRLRRGRLQRHARRASMPARGARVRVLDAARRPPGARRTTPSRSTADSCRASAGALERRHVRQIPYLLGANADEGTLFFIGATPITTPEEYTAALQARFGDMLAAQIETVYPVTRFVSPQAALVRVFGDGALLCATYDVARRVAAAGRRTYVYEFARVPPMAVRVATEAGGVSPVPRSPTCSVRSLPRALAIHSSPRGCSNTGPGWPEKGRQPRASKSTPLAPLPAHDVSDDEAGRPRRQERCPQNQGFSPCRL